METSLPLICLLLGFTESKSVQTSNETVVNQTLVTTSHGCLTAQEAEEVCNKLQNMPSEEDVLQLISDDLMGRSEVSNWRQGSMRDRNKHILQEQLFTDCSFIVGPENNTQPKMPLSCVIWNLNLTSPSLDMTISLLTIVSHMSNGGETIKAHKVLLQRASPLFEAIFSRHLSQRPIRIPDVSPSAFNRLIEFLYTGDTCLEDFDEACELIGVASKFQVPVLVQRSRAYLWASLYPGNVWRAHKCSNDTLLRESALQIAQWRTEETLTDPKFADIPHKVLMQFLSQDNLNIRSELQLLDASLLWASAEISRKNMSNTAASLRNVLGPALGLIRFLTLTPKEFAESHQVTSRVLNCTERLAILFNLNAPGILPMPSNISQNKNSRVTLSNKKVIDTLVPPNSCNNDTFKSVNNTFDLFATKIKSVSTNRTIRGFYIPSQVHKSQASYLENITIYVVNPKNVVQAETVFQGNVQYNTLIFVRIQQSVTLSTCSEVANCQQIRVRPRAAGRYPSVFSATNGNKSISAGMVSHEYVRDLGIYTYILYLDGFVHSIVL